MSLYASSSSTRGIPTGKTEFEILKDSHKFLRDDPDAKSKTWEDQLAQKYYDSLFREYAVCDLKHYKSGNFALRWRTENEVISGAGETTCGNTRCPLHSPRNHDPEDGVLPGLKTLELPFAYAEQGENKLALVKVVLCDKCCRKLTWKRNKEKERQRAQDAPEAQADEIIRQAEVESSSRVDEKLSESSAAADGRKSRRREDQCDRKRSSRSRSPRRRTREERRHRSP